MRHFEITFKNGNSFTVSATSYALIRSGEKYILFFNKYDIQGYWLDDIKSLREVEHKTIYREIL